MVEDVDRFEDVNGEAVTLGGLLRAHGVVPVHVACIRKVDIRLLGKGNSNSRGARPVYSFR